MANVSKIQTTDGTVFSIYDETANRKLLRGFTVTDEKDGTQYAIFSPTNIYTSGRLQAKGETILQGKLTASGGAQVGGTAYFTGDLTYLDVTHNPPIVNVKTEINNLNTGLASSKTKSGTSITISDAAAIYAEEIVVSIAGMQSGTGDPSPDNIRPITGRQGVKLYHSGEDTEESEVLDIVFPEAAGMVYDGTLTLDADGSGELIVNKIKHTIVPGNITSAADIGSNVRCGIYTLSRVGMPNSTGYNGFIISNLLKTVGANYSSDVSGVYMYNDNGLYIKLPKTSLESADLEGFRKFLTDHPMEIAYELEAPMVYRFAAGQLSLLKGVNNIRADAGEVSLTYQPDNVIGELKAILQAQQAEIDELRALITAELDGDSV